MGKRFVWILLALMGLAAIAYSFMPSPVFVETVVIGRGPLSVDVLEEGKTRIIDRFVISSPVTGVAQRIELDVGDVVKRGAVLLLLAPQASRVLDSRSRAESRARVAASEASLKAAQAKVAGAEAEGKRALATLNRLEALQKEGLSSEASIDEALAQSRISRANLRSAEFSVKIAQYRLEEAQAALRVFDEDGDSENERVSIRAPIDGQVLKILHQSEGVVQAGEALIEIGDPRQLEVEVDVLSSDAVLIQAGMRVAFERWGGDEALKGRVRVVEPAGFTQRSALGVEEQRVLVRSDITSPRAAWARLGDGFRVEARFFIWEGENVLKAPTNALFRYEDGWTVFIAEGGKARRKSVEIGRQNGISVEIRSGLTQGDRVISHPSDALEEGVAVRMN